MQQNPHIGSDVLAFLDSITPDTPETQLVEKQELFRIALTQAMRDLRKQVGLTQKQLAEKLGVGQSWLSKLESANNDHTFESVIAYLNALGADFEVSILLHDEKVAVVATQEQVKAEESNTRTNKIGESSEYLQPKAELKSPEFSLITQEEKNKCYQAKTLVASSGLWGAAA